MVLTLEEILPLHKGTQGYTEYEFGDAFVEHMMENEHLEDCKMGHIHSHNTMGVFFSGTDWSELEDNAPKHNFYLSLIVNNFMDFCAKVCFIAESTDNKEFDFTAKDENGQIYKYKSENYLVETKKLIVYDCNIISPSDEITVTDDFKKKVKTIIKNAEEIKVNKINKTDNWLYPNLNKNNNKNHINNSIGYYSSQYKNNSEDYLEDNLAIDTPQNDDVELLKIENFTVFILNMGNNVRNFPKLNVCIENIVKYYKKYNLNGRALVKSILDQYVPLYEKFFNSLSNSYEPDVFTYRTEKVIENLELAKELSEVKYMGEILDPTIKGLKSMLKNFNKI